MGERQRTPEQEARRREIVERMMANEKAMAGYRDSRARHERGEKGIPGKQVQEEARARRKRA